MSMTVQEQPMEVTDFDVRNIRFFARIFACNLVDYDDLYQEGWLAALTAKKPEHKYRRIKQAILRYRQKEERFHTMPDDFELPEESEDTTVLIDKLDTLKHLLETTQLTEEERLVIDMVYFSDDIEIQEDVAEKFGLTQQRIQQIHAKAMSKLVKAGRKVLRDES